MARITTNLSLQDEQLWYDFQAECKRRRLTASGVIETLIREKLEDWAEQAKFFQKKEKQDEPMGLQVLP